MRVDPLQLCGEHTVPDAYCRQAPAPSQLPSRPQLVVPSSGQSAPGSCPAGTGSHEPTCPETLHARQLPAQPSLQQTPSTQKPDAHSAAPAQFTPLGCSGTQVVPEQ